MANPVDTVHDFYAAIAAGDTEKMTALMDPGHRVDFCRRFQHVEDRGPEEVMKKVFMFHSCRSGNSFSPASFGVLFGWKYGGVS